MAHIAIMHPYLFPYLGYYQLVYHVSEFILFDDVNFIKRGYINRNSILCDGDARRFTLPVHNASQNRLIRDHYFLDDSNDVLRLIDQSYRNAPNFHRVYPIIYNVFNDENRSVVHVATQSIRCVFDYLDLQKRFSLSSNVMQSPSAKGEQKIIEICVAKDARRYTNAIGGMELYRAEAFRERGIVLEFIQMNNIDYPQLSKKFVPNLSIIDILMHCSKEQIASFLSAYTIQSADSTSNLKTA